MAIKEVNPEYLLIVNQPIKEEVISRYVCACGSNCLEIQVNWKVEQPFSKEKIHSLVVEHCRDFGIMLRSRCESENEQK